MQAQKTAIIANTIANLLQNKSVTFANIEYVTDVKPAAKHKGVTIKKHTVANVQLFSNVHSDVYALAVKRSAAKDASNDAANIANFASSANYYEHTDCYSIVQHRQNAKQYLYCIYNSAKSVYYINDVPATKEQVAAYLTPSAAAALLQDVKTVHNVTHDITHNVIVRTIALDNIISITASKQTVAF
jgi:hypothetical protein